MSEEIMLTSIERKRIAEAWAKKEEKEDQQND